ncbi:MAG TPA: heterodisulfide reductase-related iron-sulfur binding cluster [Ilumatobacteraceae bacterium]|mgnify:CR=1 FL=1|nr:heterodisulfide reductase-related iron-sulfur binding cluster [Ilumatobacteraceae bacterium]
MTITYDPKHTAYLDEADVRHELTRVYDICHGCRLCFKFCSSFPSLFEMIDAHPDQDAGRLTPAQQDRVVDECFQCKLCYVNCPYIPTVHPWAVDFPRLMLRTQAMRQQQHQIPARQRMSNQIIGRTDLVGVTATRLAPLANGIVGAKPGGLLRKALQKVTGISSVRVLPPYARQRFSTWFKQRPKTRLDRRQARVTVFPTCLVEYQAPEVGHDLVKVYEHNGIECSIAADVGCCGAPWLHSGNIDQFTKVATKNVAALARHVRAGTTIVVPEPTCSYVLKRDYVDYVGGEDAALVAENTADACEFLMGIHQDPSTRLDTEFPGNVPTSIAYHVPCHLRAQNIGPKSRDLLALTGAPIRAVQQCSGIDGMWGLRHHNTAISLPMAVKLGEAISSTGADVVVGDCHLANTAISDQLGGVVMHPLQVIARAYGTAPENE